MNKSTLKIFGSIAVITMMIGCGGSTNEPLQEPVELSEELKDSITYMFNEERLAKDVYLAINEVQPVFQLYKIATDSETQHIDAVDDLAIKYDLNVTSYDPTLEPYDSDRTPGRYNVAHVQELYDLLYAKGIQSERDALEVGCMVEVVDVNDLNEYIEQAKDSNVLDIENTFTSLRDGSYNHYWAFDKGLKDIGVEDGCCAVEPALGYDFCHPEYPNDEAN